MIKWWIVLPLILHSPFSYSSNAESLKRLTNVSHIIQDDDGFIWLTGQQGLSRFDGENLITFSNHNNEWSLPFTWTLNASLVNDKLLLSTESSKAWLFDPRTTIATPLPIELNDNTIYDAAYHNEYYYAYAADLAGIYRFNEQNQKTELIVDNINHAKFLANEQRLYFYQANKLFQVIDKQVKQIIEQPIDDVISLQDKLFVISANNIKVLKDNQIVKEQNLAFQIKAATKSNDSSSLYLLDEQGVFHQYSANLFELEHSYPAIGKNNIRQIFQDRSHVMWTISSSGVQRVSPSFVKNKPFHFNTVINAINITNFKNTIVIGSYGQGLHNFDESAPIIPKEISDKLTGKSKTVTSLKTNGDKLFIATFDGVWCYDTASKEIKKLNFSNNNEIILDIQIYGDTLYIATDGDGFISYDITNKQIIERLGKNQPFGSPEILNIAEIDNNTLWLATANSVDIYHKISKKIQSIDLPGSSKVISMVYANNKIFTFTMGDGVFVLDKNGALLSQFGHGINFNRAKLIGSDIWAPSRSGLFKISPVNHELLMIPNTEVFSFTSEPVVVEDTVYIGHYGGIISMPVIDISPFSAPIYISKTTVSGNSYLLNNTIDISTANDVVQLDLASLDYRLGKEKQYQYQINDSTWNKVNGSQLTLTGLASGDYYVTIRGTNSLGQWSNKHAFTHIKVAFPWYWTPKMRLLYVMIFGAVLAITCWLLYLRSRSISHIHQLLASNIKVRGKIALNVTRNINEALLLCEHVNKLDSQELASSQEKVKTLLTASINELNEQNEYKEPDCLHGKTLGVALPYLTDFIHRKYHANIDLHNQLIDESIDYEMQSDIYSIIYQSLSSAILNGDGRNFKLQLQNYKNKIWLTIADDGSSFTRFNNKINFDIAMYFTRQIVNKYSASINTFDKKPQGSQLVISIPLLPLS